jgi:hypothetical protein
LKNRIDDGRWHRLKIMRKRRVGVLQVDKNRPVKGKSAKGSQVLNTDGYLWIGNEYFKYIFKSKKKKNLFWSPKIVRPIKNQQL